MKKFILSIICLFGICFNAFSAETFNTSTGKIDNYSGVGEYKFQDFPPNENIYREEYINKLALLIYGASKNYTDSIDWQIINNYPTTYVTNTIIETLDLQYSFNNYGFLELRGNKLDYYRNYRLGNASGNHISNTCSYLTFENYNTIRNHAEEVELKDGNQTIAKMDQDVAIFHFYAPYDCLLLFLTQGEVTSSAGDFINVYMKMSNGQYRLLSCTREEYSESERLQPLTLFAAKNTEFIVIPYTEIIYDKGKTKPELLNSVGNDFKNRPNSLKGNALSDEIRVGLLNEGPNPATLKVTGAPQQSNAIWFSNIPNMNQIFKVGQGTGSAIPTYHGVWSLDAIDFAKICKTHHRPYFCTSASGEANGDYKTGYRLLPRYANGSRPNFTQRTSGVGAGDIRFYGSDNNLFATIIIYPLGEVSY